MPAAKARPATRTAPTAEPRSDAYVVLLSISLVAMLAGCVFLYLDYSQYKEGKPPQPPARQAPAAPPPAQAAPVQPMPMPMPPM